VLDKNKIKIPRRKICEALKAEGIEFFEGFINVHLYPMFQNKIAYGSKGFPWFSDVYDGKVSYKKGVCPIAEELNEETLFGYGFCTHDLKFEDIDLIIEAFKKVWNNLNEL